jgi:ankyrin repeat protein
MLCKLYINCYSILQGGNTPLILASSYGHVQVCELLLNRVAGIDYTNEVVSVSLVCDVMYIILIISAFTCYSMNGQH